MKYKTPEVGDTVLTSSGGTIKKLTVGLVCINYFYCLDCSQEAIAAAVSTVNWKVVGGNSGLIGYKLFPSEEHYKLDCEKESLWDALYDYLYTLSNKEGTTLSQLKIAASALGIDEQEKNV